MTHPKVTTQLIGEAQRLRGKSRTQEEIAVELGVSQSTVSIILRATGLGGYLVRTPAPLTLLRRSAEKVG